MLYQDMYITPDVELIQDCMTCGKSHGPVKQA